MARFIRKLASLVKIEATYGLDAAPTGSANAVQMSNVQLEPMAGSQVSRELLLPYMGHQGVILTGTYTTLQGDVEIAGAGAAGSAPGYGALLRMAGFQEAINAGVDCQYSLLSEGFEAGSIYYNLDGQRHVLLGSRATLTMAFTPLQIPRFRFNIMGLQGTITDVPLPTVDLTKFQVPLPVNKTNTTLSLHAYSAIAESLNLDLGGKLEPRFLIGDESIKITDRQSVGTAVIEAGKVADKAWFAIAAAHTKGALALQHGQTAGNIVKVDAPKVQLGRITQGATQGITNYSIPLMLTPNAGNDELLLTIK